MKLPSQSAKGKRYGSTGRDLEEVTFTVNQVSNSVYLHIEGSKVMKSYVMTLAEWRRLDTATEM